MGLNLPESSLQIVSVLFVAISQAAAAQFTNLSSLMRSLCLLQSATINVRFLTVVLLDDMNPVISGMMCGSASGVGYPCSSVRWSLCSVRVMRSSFRATVSVSSVCRALPNFSASMRALAESRGCGSVACFGCMFWCFS